MVILSLACFIPTVKDGTPYHGHAYVAGGFIVALMEEIWKDLKGD